jgi:glycosyltransferase involved in cell wall biosynthesis
VQEHAVPGPWPAPAREDLARLATIVRGLPDGALALVDGLVASSAPGVLVPESARLRLVVLVHMPAGDDAAAGSATTVAHRQEAEVLAAACGVVTSSPWSRQRLVERHSLPAARIHVAEPGVDPGRVAVGTASGGELLCVAAVAPHKGQDLLLAALTEVAHLPWTCRCVGRLDRDPGFVDRLRAQARDAGLHERVRFDGPLTGERLDAAYAGADLLVHPSRGETYGMVVTEALAHGLPVVATAVGGLPEALDGAPGRERPGLLVPPEDPSALAGALHAWLAQADLRRRLRQAARRRRTTLSGWSSTADRVARVLRAVA